MVESVLCKPIITLCSFVCHMFALRYASRLCFRDRFIDTKLPSTRSKNSLGVCNNLHLLYCYLSYCTSYQFFPASSPIYTSIMFDIQCFLYLKTRRILTIRKERTSTTKIVFPLLQCWHDWVSSQHAHTADEIICVSWFQTSFDAWRLEWLQHFAGYPSIFNHQATPLSLIIGSKIITTPIPKWRWNYIALPKKLAYRGTAMRP